MRTDSRLPRVLHVLLHLEHIKDPMTSDQIGQMLGMNASLVRRTMAGLRDAGFLKSTKGHGGGWYLAKPLTEITLAQVYDALGQPTLFAVGQSDDAPACLLEKAANAATENALIAARGVFTSVLAKTTVADLAHQTRDQIHRFQSQPANAKAGKIKPGKQRT